MLSARALLNLFARLRSQNAHINEPRAMIPSGTPKPAPSATSCEPVVGAELEELEHVLSLEEDPDEDVAFL